MDFQDVLGETHNYAYLSHTQTDFLKSLNQREGLVILNPMPHQSIRCCSIIICLKIEGEKLIHSFEGNCILVFFILPWKLKERKSSTFIIFLNNPLFPFSNKKYKRKKHRKKKKKTIKQKQKKKHL